MEDVLSVYQREFRDDEVLVCMDETTKQQTKETRVPVGMGSGRTAIYDYEYERNGVRACLCFRRLLRAGVTWR